MGENSYWFEVGRILKVEGETGIKDLIERQVKSIRDARALPSHDAEIVAFGRVGKRVTVAARSPENPTVPPARPPTLRRWRVLLMVP